MPGWDEYQLHNLCSKLIALQIPVLRTCATVTIILQLQFIRRVNAPALKLGFFCSSVGIWSLKDFSQLFLFITVLIPGKTLQKAMYSSEVFLAENLTAIHGTNPVPCLFKVQLLSAEVSCNLKKEKQESSFLLNKPNFLKTASKTCILLLGSQARLYLRIHKIRIFTIWEETNMQSRIQTRKPKPIWFNVILHTKLNCLQWDSERSLTISNLLNSKSRFSFTPQLCQEQLWSLYRHGDQGPLL